MPAPSSPCLYLPLHPTHMGSYLLLFHATCAHTTFLPGPLFTGTAAHLFPTTTRTPHCSLSNTPCHPASSPAQVMQDLAAFSSPPSSPPPRCRVCIWFHTAFWRALVMCALPLRIYRDAPPHAFTHRLPTAATHIAHTRLPPLHYAGILSRVRTLPPYPIPLTTPIFWLAFAANTCPVVPAARTQHYRFMLVARLLNCHYYRLWFFSALYHSAIVIALLIPHYLYPCTHTRTHAFAAWAHAFLSLQHTHLPSPYRTVHSRLGHMLLRLLLPSFSCRAHCCLLASCCPLPPRAALHARDSSSRTHWPLCAYRERALRRAARVCCTRLPAYARLSRLLRYLTCLCKIFHILAFACRCRCLDLPALPLLPSFTHRLRTRTHAARTFMDCLCLCLSFTHHCTQHVTSIAHLSTPMLPSFLLTPPHTLPASFFPCPPLPYTQPPLLCLLS